MVAWMLLLIGVLAVVGSVRWLAGRKRAARDEIYAGVTPGLLPLGMGTIERTKALEYNGPVAVAFQPPKGVTPGLIGMVIDGKVDPHDITATIIDLAARGHMTIEVVKDVKQNWTLTKTTDLLGDDLLDYERRFLAGIFARADAVTMSSLMRFQPEVFTQAAEGIYREAQQRGWYASDPGDEGRKMGGYWMAGGVLAGATSLMIAPTVVGAAAGAAFVGAGIVGLFDPGSRVPRTASGSAVRIQALGFKQYLATAEADQIKFEEAAEIFSRYLPYAMVFGVAEHWAKVFRDLAVRAEEQNIVFDSDLVWLVSLNAVANLGDLAFMVGGLDGLLEGLGGLFESLDGVGDIFEGIADSIGDIFG